MASPDDLMIRLENSQSAEERAAIRAINEAAFGGAEEADLVDNLSADGNALLSLVAELQKRLVGHLLFIRMWIETPDRMLTAVALVPVLPEHQRQGVGGRLIRYGLGLLRAERDDRHRCRTRRLLSVIWLFSRKGAFTRQSLPRRCVHGHGT